MSSCPLDKMNRGCPRWRLGISTRPSFFHSLSHDLANAFLITLNILNYRSFAATKEKKANGDLVSAYSPGTGQCGLHVILAAFRREIGSGFGPLSGHLEAVSQGTPPRRETTWYGSPTANSPRAGRKKAEVRCEIRGAAVVQNETEVIR